ncbi:hypothetical protein DX130_01070 [Paenibacillus paeoniae]|uniref:Cysteine-rich CWC family protein n=2 Tax=Paenibacillus paeoniae TaxID=2292705 RepID=A0A371PHU3_9BACL|nr:hypothetical protein DX130_01070 [Paenibacillus paeoniae]
MMSAACPLCGGGNSCAALLEENPRDCWCFHAAIPKELLARIPEEARGKSCVCENCVRAYQVEAAKM